MDNTQTRNVRIACMAGVACWLLLISSYSYRRPAYNFDMVPYMALTLIREGHNVTEAQSIVRETIRREIDPQKYALITDPSNRYRQTMLRDPRTLENNLPMYAVKPLYTWATYLFYKGGIPLTRSTVLPSLIAYVLICLLTFRWLIRYCSPGVASLLTILISLWAPVIEASQLSTPDMLCALLIMAAAFFLLDRRPALVYVSCLLAITARIDCFLPSVLLVTLSQLKRFNGHTNLGRLSFLISGLVLCYFAVTFSVRTFGWGMNFYGDYIRYLNSAYENKRSFSLPDYIDLVKSQAMTGLYYSNVVLYFIFYIMIAGIRRFPKVNSLNNAQLLLTCFALVILIRFLLQPVVADRFYVAYYLCALVVFIQTISEARKHSGQVLVS